MLSLETITTFFASAVLLALAPGPDNIFVLTQGALYGAVSGIAVTLGCDNWPQCETEIARHRGIVSELFESFISDEAGHEKEAVAITGVN